MNTAQTVASSTAGASKPSVKVPIKVRKMNFAIDEVNTPFFFKDNAVLSSLIASLSGAFPPGEKKFVKSVLHYRDQIVNDKELMREVQAFAGQEGQHSHQHRLMNEHLDGMGFYASRISDILERSLQRTGQKLSPEAQLASTVSMEHITAVLGEFVLNNPEVLDGVPESVQKLLAWHAVEEIEHKAVAFDVYDKCVGDRNYLRLVSAIQLVAFILMVGAFQTAMLGWIKHRPTLRELAGAWSFLGGKNGALRKIAGPYFELYKKDFHPWNNDNRDLIEKWKKTFEDAPAPQAA